MVGRPLSEMPAGGFTVAPARPSPVRVSVRVAPVPPVGGLIVFSTGTGAVRVNVTAFVVPKAGSVTVIVFAPSGALMLLLTLAVIELRPTVTMLAVMFGVAVIDVTPERLVPVKVTRVVAPALADVG